MGQARPARYASPPKELNYAGGARPGHAAGRDHRRKTISPARYPQIDHGVVAGGSARQHLRPRATGPRGRAFEICTPAERWTFLPLLDPIVAAGGRRMPGQVTLDTTITGTVAAPSVAGSARLAGGEVQDYASGLHLSEVAVQVEGNGAALRVAQFSAKAGPGTIGGGGSYGIMAPRTAGGPDNHRARRTTSPAI